MRRRRAQGGTGVGVRPASAGARRARTPADRRLRGTLFESRRREITLLRLRPSAPRRPPPLPATSPLVSVDARVGPDRTLRLALRGRLEARSAGAAWRKVTSALWTARPRRIVLDASELEYCDGVGLSLLVDLQRRQHRRGGELELVGLDAGIAERLARFSPERFPQVRARPVEPLRALEQIGRVSQRIGRDLYEQVRFLGELVAALAYTLARFRRRLRVPDMLAVAEKVGVDALPIVALVGYLIGLILAFQSAQPLRRFGAEIYAADLVAISMVRELGPLMTAVVLAGRSGSAFAAEIGTMTVNEEIDALVTMGLDPVRFLVVTRVLAAVAMAPLLTLFFELCGLAGGALVLVSLGFPFVTYANEVLSAIDLTDVAGGLFKSIVFGLLVAGIGCLRGLQTKGGPSAVGDSTTSAVVSGIVLVVVADGVFSVLFHQIGI